MLKKKDTILIILIFLFFSISKDLYSRENTPVLREISMNDGLSDLTVRSMYKDYSGFLWFGTDCSLDRYDGINIISYKTDSQRKNNPIYSITSDSTNQIWLGCSVGLFYLDKNENKLKQYAESVIDFPVYDLLYHNNGKLYIATNKGLFEYDGKNLVQILLENNILSRSNRIKGICANNDNIWAVSENGLFSYNVEKKEIKDHISSDKSIKSFTSISIIENTLYIGTSGSGIYKYEIDKSILSKIKILDNSIITSLYSNDSLLNIATDGNGIYDYSHSHGKMIRAFNHDISNKSSSSIRSNSVYSYFTDRDGLMWIAYYQGGIDYSLYQKRIFDIYSNGSLFNSEGYAVRTFSQYENYKVIGTREGLYLIDESKEFISSFTNGELTSNLILSSIWYKGKFYIGTYGGGAWTLEPQKRELKRLKMKSSPLDKEHVFCFTIDNEDNLWLGSSEGVFVIDGLSESDNYFNSKNSQLLDGNAYEIFFDTSGKGWICTESGISLYDKETKSIHSNIFPEGFINKEKVRFIYQDNSSKLYFLPEKGDIFISDINMTDYSYLTFENIDYGNSFMSMIQDKSGNFWIAADGGLLCYNPIDEQLYTFGFQDGLPSQLFTNRSAYSDKDGKLWFGNSKGLLSFDPQQIDFTKRYPYNLQITSVGINGDFNIYEPFSESKEIKKIVNIGNRNNISVSFTPLTYSSLNSLLFEYKLEGYDKQWNNKMGSNTINYHDLSPGKYKFMVKISGIDESLAIKEIHIALSSFFWYSLVVVLIIVGLIVVILFKIYFTRSKKKFNNEESLVAETEKSDQEKYKNTKHSNEYCESLARSLSDYIAENDIYKDPDLKITDLANALDTSSHSLSYLFNQYLNVSYSDFINEYRVNHFKKLIQEQEYDKYTLTALAEQCGFNSRASFFRSFKKSTGMTPKEYMQHSEIKKEK